MDAKYLPDAGLRFQEQNGLVYGWSTDNREWTRYRDMERFRGGRHEDNRFNTLAHFNANYWEIEVPNGTYLVETIEIEVNNGRIKIDAGNTPATRGRINYVDIESVAQDFAAYINFQPIDKFADWHLTLENGLYQVTIGLGEYAIETEGSRAILVNRNDVFKGAGADWSEDKITTEVIANEGTNACIVIDISNSV